MSKVTIEKVFEIIDSELEKRKEHTFLLWDFPNDVKKRIEELDNKKSNLEQELGCPLEVVFKALKNRQVIFKHIVGLENPKITLETHKIAGLLFDGKNYGLWLYENGYGDEFYVYTKDYGKTWWLKGDMENEED